jgi:hypothetical protein
LSVDAEHDRSADKSPNSTYSEHMSKTKGMNGAMCDYQHPLAVEFDTIVLGDEITPGSSLGKVNESYSFRAPRTVEDDLRLGEKLEL